MSNYYSKDDYATELGDDASTIDIYDTFVALFDSIDFICTSILFIVLTLTINEKYSFNICIIFNPRDVGLYPVSVNSI